MSVDHGSKESSYESEDDPRFCHFGGRFAVSADVSRDHPRYRHRYSGAVVAGAKVSVKNVDTGLERTTTTSADGSYTVPELPLGTYTVTITQSGFQTSVTTGVVVDVATERRVDAALKTGQVEQRVEVSGDELPQVETTSAELGGTLTTEAIANIPVNGRDYTKLIYLNPGVSGSPDQITDSPGSFGTFSMNGSRGRANNFLLDGTDMNDGFRNDPAINEAGVFGDPATILPIDAVAELRVLSNYEAEYGRNSGAVVNIVTKSGTNQCTARCSSTTARSCDRRRAQLFQHRRQPRIRSTTTSSADRSAVRS